MPSDYPLDLLGPERFQEFCQALLTREFPGVQCFPVGQPDGGRDAYAYPQGARADAKSVVFQVKFSRDPSKVLDVVEWLTDIAEGEKEKARRLIAAGAKTYYLITNVAGTSHPGVGTMDRLREALSQIIGVNSCCMWRADICRRLDDAWDLKWSYPELMTGPDLIRYAIEHGLNEHATRRANAIRAFVRAQYSIDEEVKFKQIDLRNHLLDLFVDVPLDDPQLLFDLPPGYSNVRYETAAVNRDGDIGAASFLLARGGAKTDSRYFVLEGAPGQGKSTISQYICQVNRMRLLERAEDIKRLPRRHTSGGIELPIKADLRDLAVWLARRNPFDAAGGGEYLESWDKTLESFLAALVRHHSGGASFDISDLHAVLSRSATILVLDGLDEVADVRRRAEVVAEITKGVERLSEVASSLRVVVTSRPAAFANSPGLRRDMFRHVNLGDMTRELISEYAEKWLTASHAGDADAQAVRRILGEKLGQVHIRDLARNPMQLAILLSLIHTKGASLPDKRTALYDSYVDLFFSREAEKSSTVRDYRDLLINLHRYLAWVLHSEAEMSNGAPGRSNGSVEENRLKNLVREYLVADCRDPALAEVLFSGVVERVVALVSRVQGTYEFEVQPLREFFAARYLYETAPYSPTGNERKGTKPERFDALCRNFYWLNVTRFFAGCYSIGELASLIDSLDALSADPDFSKLRHPRVLTATLLGDWVFSQQYRAVTAAAGLIGDEFSFRLLLTHTSSRSGEGQALAVPRGCGGGALVNRALDLLWKTPPMELALEIAEFVRQNADRQELLQRWGEAVQKCEELGVERWIEYGRVLGCLSIAPFELVTDAIRRVEDQKGIARSLILADRTDILEYDEAALRTAVDVVLGPNPTFTNWTKARLDGSRPVAKLAAALNPQRFVYAFGAEPKTPIGNLYIGDGRHNEVGPLLMPDSTERLKLTRFLKKLETVGQIPVGTWQSSIGPWALLLDAIQEFYGEREICFTLALLASRISAASEDCSDCHEFSDTSKSLLRRVWYASHRINAVRWWRVSLEQVTANDDFRRLCGVWLVVAGRTALQQTAVDFDKVMRTLSPEEWGDLFRFVRGLDFWRAGEMRRSGAGWEVLQNVSIRTKLLLAQRFRKEDADQIRIEIMDGGGALDLTIQADLKEVALGRLGAKAGDWKEALSICRTLFAHGVLSDRDTIYRHPIYTDQPIKLAVAEEIVNNYPVYPTLLLDRAERAFRRKAAARARPILSIAQAEGWFRDVRASRKTSHLDS